METKKLCINCKYIVPSTNTSYSVDDRIKYSECGHPNNANLVSGNPNKSCASMRVYGCNESARFFEERDEPLVLEEKHKSFLKRFYDWIS